MKWDSVLRYDALLLTSLLWFIGKVLRHAFPPLFGTFQDLYSVSNTAVGTAFTGFMVIYAIMQFPSGAFADRIGPSKVIIGGAIVTILGSLLVILDAPFLVLAAAMVIIGGGTGLHKTVAIDLLSHVYPDRTGRALGALDTFGTMGGVVAPIVIVIFLSLKPITIFATTVIPAAPWRAFFLLVAVVATLIVIAFGIRVPQQVSKNDGETNTDSSPGIAEYLKLFRAPRFSIFVLVTILVAFSYHAVVAFLPLYLTHEFSVSTATASLLYSLMFGASFLQLAFGELSDHVGRLKVIVATLGIALLSFIAILSIPDATLFVLGTLVVGLGIGYHGFQPVRGAYLMEVLPSQISGGGLGVVRSLLMGAGAISPALTGYLADTAGFRVAFGVLATALILATVLGVGLWLIESTETQKAL